jgi:hypothetical protein
LAAAVFKVLSPIPLDPADAHKSSCLHKLLLLLLNPMTLIKLRGLWQVTES